MTAVLAEILLNNRNTVGTGMDNLLSSALGLNWAQLTVVRAMDI